MTCIVGIRTPTGVIIGGDSAGVAGWRVDLRKDPKVFIRGSFAMGFTTSFRMGQLLEYALDPPTPPNNDADLFSYMVIDFVNALRITLKGAGWATQDKGQEGGGSFLIGFRNRLFRIDSDYQVGENLSGYDAVGCGAEAAMGAMYASEGQSPAWRVRTALQAAEASNMGVRGPFKLVTMDHPQSSIHGHTTSDPTPRP